MIASVRPAMTIVVGSAVPRCRTYSVHLPTNADGTVDMRSPSRSLTWVEKMTRAIPLVNPVTTGNGMNLMAPPNRASPNPTSMTPPITVAIMRPSTP